MPRPAAADDPKRRRARPVLTGRALVLGAVVVLFVVLLASPLSRYLGSRNDIRSAATQLQHDRAQLAQLTRQKAEWSDPGYVQQQARIRLQYAMPGDTVYVVVDKGAPTQIERTTGRGGGAEQAGQAWNTRLWHSITAASR
ncbi:MAG TPA: septum formation initiator family protein [Jatrophihabitans sp.]|nr:septum formation initiator family protein [Jatrophihabitans sp.]